MDLGEGAVAVEPVEGLRDGGGVDRSGREREVLGRTVEHILVRQRPGQPRPHPRHRLDRDDPRSGADQQPGQLSGARGEIEDRPSRPEAEAVGKPRERLVGIVGARTLVIVGRGVEELRGAVDRHGGIVLHTAAAGESEIRYYRFRYVRRPRSSGCRTTA